MTPGRLSPRAVHEGLLLIGGRSSRFLPDKMQETLEGRPLYDHALGVLARLCTHIWVSTGREHALAEQPVPTGVTLQSVADGHPGHGPLEGIRSVMAHSTAARLLVLAGDLPRVRVETLTRLLDAPPADVVCARDASSGQLQPLCALWRVSLLPDISRALDEGQRGVQRFLAQCQLHTIDVPAAELLNVNRPTDMPGFGTA